MKRILIIGASIVLLALIQSGGWSQTKYVPKENEELYATWINERNPKGDMDHPQKDVSAPGRYELYYSIADSEPFETGTVEIEAKWTDSEGNIWYKAFGTVSSGSYKGYRYQTLAKISKSGTVREEQVNPIGMADFSPDNYPTEIDSKSSQYSIMYRSAS